MGKTMFFYGLLAGGFNIACVFAISAMGLEHSQFSIVYGYLIMFAALSLVFVGVKQVRDTRFGGVIRFWYALVVGLAISLVATLTYVVGWEAYLWATHYTFFDHYAAEVLASKRAAGASPAALAKLSTDLATQARAYAEPVGRMAMTAFEILPPAIVVSLISAALLRKSSFLPFRRGSPN